MTAEGWTTESGSGYKITEDGELAGRPLPARDARGVVGTANRGTRLLARANSRE